MFNGLLKARPANGVIREAGFLFSPLVGGVGEVGDPTCRNIPVTTNSKTSLSICNSTQLTLSPVSLFRTGTEQRNISRNVSRIIICSIFFTAVLWASFIPKSFAAIESSSVSYSVERLASAIKLAENSKTKPYGIMRDYCHAGAEAQCRKGCIQTIQKRMKLWEAEGRPGDFIDYLAKTYAPTSGNLRSAEKSLNPHWPKNVKHFYRKGGGK